MLFLLNYNLVLFLKHKLIPRKKDLTKYQIIHEEDLVFIALMMSMIRVLGQS